MLVVLSIVMVMNKRDIRCRIHEDNVETWIPDLNGNIQRKENRTIVINFKNELE